MLERKSGNGSDESNTERKIDKQNKKKSTKLYVETEN